MRVLACGSREWNDRWAIEAFLGGLLAGEDDLCVIEGGARGADRIAGQWAAARRMSDHVAWIRVPADWQAHGKAAGSIRNQLMLDECEPDVVVAFKDDFDWTLKRGGTEDMVRRARDAGLPVYVVGRV